MAPEKGHLSCRSDHSPPPGREQLTAAKTASNGRSALDEHESPGEATLLVLQGRVQHTSPDAS